MKNATIAETFVASRDWGRDTDRLVSDIRKASVAECLQELTETMAVRLTETPGHMELTAFDGNLSASLSFTLELLLLANDQEASAWLDYLEALIPHMRAINDQQIDIFTELPLLADTIDEAIASQKAS